MREALGVTGHFIPWNYPAPDFRAFGRGLARLRQCLRGQAGRGWLALDPDDGQMALDVGFPKGALNVVTGLGAEAGAALTAHPGLDFISFTGSPEVGTQVQQAAASNHVGVTLGTGRQVAATRFRRCRYRRAGAGRRQAITQNGGQTCSAGSRLLVQRSAYGCRAGGGH